MADSMILFTPYSISRNNLGSPSDLMVSIVRRGLFHSECLQARGYAVITGMRQYFSSRRAKLFRDVDDSIADDTAYLCNLLSAVMRKYGKAVSIRCLPFDGLGRIRAKDLQSVNYGMFRGEASYHRMSRFGVERIVDGLIRMAKRNGVLLDRECFFEDALFDDVYQSIKRPHFDSFSGIGAIQKNCEGIQGGHTVVYDIGQFCNDWKVKPWDILVAHSPDPREIFGDCEFKFKPFNALVPRDEYLEDICKNYSRVVTSRDDEVVIFNNMIVQDKNGQFHGIAHGATPPVCENLGEAKRNVCLTIASEPCSFSRTKEIYQKMAS